jgi:predicted DNA-binding protein (UPF0251 family)
LPRPRKERKCRHHAGDRVFKPRSIPMPELEIMTLGEDELEALRLCDVEGLHQAVAGERMGVSRGTVQRLLKTGRETLVRAVAENAALVIGSEAASVPNTKTKGNG